MLNKYLISIFNKEFIPMFFILFSIMSIIVTIDIANSSSVIKISFTDFFMLYLYQTPTMILWVTPILFFVSMANSIKKSCLESEMIVMFSLGLKPFRMFRIYAVYAFLTSILLMIMAIGMIPMSEYLNKSFIHDKKTTQSINLNTSDYGQQFGEWFFFVNKDKKDLIKNIVLFHHNENSDRIVIADKARVGDLKKSFELILSNGKSYVYSNNELLKIHYKEMSVFDSIIIGKFDYDNLFQYWVRIYDDKKLMKNFVLGINIALFPLVALYGIFGLSFLKPRISKDKVGLYSFYYIAGFVTCVHIFIATIGLWTILVNPILFVLISYALFKIRVSI